MSDSVTSDTRPQVNFRASPDLIARIDGFAHRTHRNRSQAAIALISAALALEDGRQHADQTIRVQL